MARIILETARLILRTEAPGDRALWCAHMNTPQVMACLGGVRTPEQVDESFERMARGWEEQGYSFMLVALRASGALIGHCGLALIEPEGAPDALRGQMQIGWTLGADHWGQGYAAEAARAALGLAFERHDAPMVYGQTSLRNTASWRLMERLGMIRRADLDYVDPAYPAQDNPTMVYEMARAHWDAQQGEATGA